MSLGAMEPTAYRTGGNQEPSVESIHTETASRVHSSCSFLVTKPERCPIVAPRRHRPYGRVQRANGRWKTGLRDRGIWTLEM